MNFVLGLYGANCQRGDHSLWDIIVGGLLSEGFRSANFDAGEIVCSSDSI